jgi:hypothetical protein
MSPIDYITCCRRSTTFVAIIHDQHADRCYPQSGEECPPDSFRRDGLAEIGLDSHHARERRARTTERACPGPPGRTTYAGGQGLAFRYRLPANLSYHPGPGYQRPRPKSSALPHLAANDDVVTDHCLPSYHTRHGQPIPARRPITVIKVPLSKVVCRILLSRSNWILATVAVR